MEEETLFDPEEMQSPFDAIKEVDGEGSEWWNSRKLAQTDTMIDVRNLDNSYEAIQFRIWARKVLKEYIIKGFVIDDERLKGEDTLCDDHFDDLLERTFEIRKSERTNCQKITDIFAEFSCDYNSKSKVTKTFYMAMQDMMQNDKDLTLLTTAFLDIAERRARRHVLTTMEEWKLVLEQYLKATDADVLPDAGSVSHEEAEAKAFGEYEKFRRIQDKTLLSDFDKYVEGLEE